MPYFLKLSEDTEPIEFLSIGEVAELCNRKKVSLVKLTARGIMPEANFRTPPSQIKRGLRKGQYIKGYRLYSKEFLVPRIVEFMKGVVQGKQITLEQRSELITMFQKEREFYEI